MNGPGRLGFVLIVLPLLCASAMRPPQATAQQRVRVRRAEQPQIRSNSQVLGRQSDGAPVRSVGTLILFEGESLAAGARASEGPVVRQSMTGFRGSWSGDAQLFWTPSHTGARLELTVRVRRAGDYGLTGFFTKAPDYGRFKVGAHGREVGTFDGYARAVERSSRVSLGRVTLEAGANQLIFVIDGKAQGSTGHYVGIDRLELVTSGSDRPIRSVVPGRRPRGTPIPRPAAPSPRPEISAASPVSELRRGIDVLNDELRRLSTGANWRRYLQLNELEQLAGTHPSEWDGASHERLRSVLERFDSTGRNPAFRAITQLRGFGQVHAALRRRAARDASGEDRLRVDAQNPAVRRLPDDAPRRRKLPDLRIVSARWVRDAWIEYEVANFGHRESQDAFVAATSELSAAARQMGIPGLPPGRVRAFRLALLEESELRPDRDYAGTVVTLEVQHPGPEQSRANNRLTLVLDGGDEDSLRLELGTLQAGVAVLERNLDRLGGGAGWKEYLNAEELKRLAVRAPEQLNAAERGTLQAIAERFEQVSRDAKYQSIATLPGFEETYGSTDSLVSRLADLQRDAVSGRPRADAGRGGATQLDFSIPLSNFAHRPTAELPRGALLFRRSGEFQLTAHVEVSPQASDQSVYFSWDVSKVPGAGGVLWQVSRVNFLPLTGGEADRAPRGLVESGTAQGQGGGFTADFATLGSVAPEPQQPAQERDDSAARQSATDPADGGARRLFGGRHVQFVLNLDQINAFANAGGAVSYYVRVIPIATRGPDKIVGQPSNVMRVFHGKMPQRNDFRFHEEGLNPKPQPQAPRDIHLTRFQYLPADTECRAHLDKSNCGKYRGRGGNKKPWERIADFVTDAWDWASGAYQTMKDKVVETVAAGLNAVLPVNVPESVLAMALDSALISAGIPPSIPNFDELMEENLDYMAELAVQEMNLPPGASDLAKEKVKEGIRAGARAARDAARGAGPGTPCDYWTAPPYFLVSLENRGNTEYVDLRIDVAHGLFDRREKTVPFLRPGQSVTIPVVLPRGQRAEFWDGQLYDEGAWWQAYNETAYDCHVFIVTRDSPDFPKGYPRSLATYLEPQRVWNTPLEREVR